MASITKRPTAGGPPATPTPQGGSTRGTSICSATASAGRPGDRDRRHGAVRQPEGRGGHGRGARGGVAVDAGAPPELPARHRLGADQPHRPRLGPRTLSSLLHSDVQGSCPTRCTRSTGRCRCCGRGGRDRLIAASPCIRIKLPSRPTMEVVPPRRRRCVARGGGRAPVRAVVVVLPDRRADLGALGLQVRDVDFLRKTLRGAAAGPADE